MLGCYVLMHFSHPGFVGAVAALVTLRIMTEARLVNPDKLACYTFGMPQWMATESIEPFCTRMRKELDNVASMMSLSDVPFPEVCVVLNVTFLCLHRSDLLFVHARRGPRSVLSSVLGGLPGCSVCCSMGLCCPFGRFGGLHVICGANVSRAVLLAEELLSLVCLFFLLVLGIHVASFSAFIFSAGTVAFGKWRTQRRTVSASHFRRFVHPRIGLGKNSVDH